MWASVMNVAVELAAAAPILNDVWAVVAAARRIVAVGEE